MLLCLFRVPRSIVESRIAVACNVRSPSNAFWIDDVVMDVERVVEEAHCLQPTRHQLQRRRPWAFHELARAVGTLGLAKILKSRLLLVFVPLAVELLYNFRLHVVVVVLVHGPYRVEQHRFPKQIIALNRFRAVLDPHPIFYEVLAVLALHGKHLVISGAHGIVQEEALKEACFLTGGIIPLRVVYPKLCIAFRLPVAQPSEQQQDQPAESATYNDLLVVWHPKNPFAHGAAAATSLNIQRLVVAVCEHDQFLRLTF
mmetsp:Transcript_54320/g.127616  ORF Transcript_54320/g.127616 Transcript_54320/m.127616 type:complete len:257 (-) Transcript_54320:3388-4158(-)